MTSQERPAIRVGGTLGLDDLYIRRAEDELAFSTLLSGEYCNILTSRQMGKSSLMVRLIARLMEKGVRTASIDMAGDLGSPPDHATWYKGFLDKLVLDFALDCDVDAFWDAAPGTPNQRLLQFFREVLGAQIEGHVVVFVDEVDASLRLAYSDDFFTVLRTVYNQRPMVSAFSRLTFCLLGTASPSELIKDRRTTPYNIGRTLELKDFDADRDPLQDLYESMNEAGGGETLVRAILRWTDGHPFLTLALCRIARESGAVTPADVDRLMDDALSESAAAALRIHFEWINNFLTTRLHEQGPAFRLYGSVLDGKKVPDGTTQMHIELKLSGLVKRDSAGRLVVRNRLYARRFGRAWLNQQRPILVQRWAIRGGLAASLLAAAVVAYSLYRVREAKSEQDGALAMALLLKLASAKGEADAAQIERDLCALSVKYDPPIVTLEDIEERRRKFWDGLAARLDAEGKSALGAGDTERALLLGALSAVKSGAEPSWLKEAYRTSYAPRLVATLRGQDMQVQRARFLGDKRLVSAGLDNTLRLWDLESGQEIQRQTVGALSAMDVCPDASCVVVADSTGSVGHLWSADLLTRVDFNLAHKKKVYSIAAIAGAEQGHWIVTGAEDGNAVRGWLTGSRGGDLDNLVTLPHHGPTGPSPVYAAQPSGSGGTIVTAAFDGVRVWDALSVGGAPKVLRSGAQAFDARFSADGTQIAAGLAGEAVVWSRRGGELGHLRREGVFLTAAFSPKDDDWVVSAVRNGTQGLVVVWRVSTPAIMFEQAMNVPVLDAAFRPDAKEVAAALADGTIRLFRTGSEPILSDPQERWQSWQRKLGRTLNEEWKLDPLPPQGPRTATVRGERVCH